MKGRPDPSYLTTLSATSRPVLSALRNAQAKLPLPSRIATFQDPAWSFGHGKGATGVSLPLRTERPLTAPRDRLTVDAPGP
jgi:hypothetical protein